MLFTWIIVQILLVTSLINGFSGSANSQCSCYTFDGRLKNLKYCRDDCRTQGGDLVSMETLEEWEFIKTQIQNRTTGIFHEWWIGLERRDGKWMWRSNHSLTYDKWQPYKPVVQPYKKCVVMSRNYPVNTSGLFSNVECKYKWKGWICEMKKKETHCSDHQVKWCSRPVTPKTMTVSTDNELYAPSLTTTKINNDGYSVAGEYPTATATAITTTTTTTTTTPYPKYYTEMSANDGLAATVVSLISKKKPSSTLTIIIVVLVVGVVVFLCCGVLCVYRWKRKLKEKPKPRLSYHVSNNGHNNSDFITGSFGGLQPNNACAREHSHPTTHWYPNRDSVNVPRSSQGWLVPSMTYDALEMGNFSNMTLLESASKDSVQNKATTEGRNPSERDSSQEHVDSQGLPDAVGKVSDIYATVDKSKKKNKAATEVVYAQVNKRSTKSMKQELVTYANLEGFIHNAARNSPQASPSYHHTEYANVSNK